jgi:diguanylate cyclase (GGDEF)-like protein
MTEAEKLPRNHPATVHVNGAPLFAGEIEAIIDQGLVMSDALPTQGKPSDNSLNANPGDEGDLVFSALFDDDGEPLIVPIKIIDIEIVGIEVNQVSLQFSSQDPIATDELLRKLKSLPGKPGGNDGSNNAEVLQELRRRSLQLIDVVLKKFLNELPDLLLNHSSSPRNADQQEEIYQTTTAIRNGRDTMCEAFSQHLDNYFDEPLVPQKPGNKTGGGAGGLSELNLVEIHDFEDSLSLNRMTIMGQDKYRVALECLTLRFAELAGLSPGDTRLPVDIAQICQAFKTGLSKNPLPHTIVPEVYVFFTNEVIRNLDEYYSGLNTYLIDEGIQANLEAELKKHGSVLRRLDKAKQDSQRAAMAKSKAASANRAAAPVEDYHGAGHEQAAGTLTQQAGEQNYSGATGGGGASGGGAPGGGAPAGGAPAGGAPAGGAPAGGAPGAGSPGELAHELVDAIKQQFNPDDLYRSVIEALNFRRESTDNAPVHSGGSGGGGAPDMQLGGPGSAGSGAGTNANVAGSSALASALTALQGDKGVRGQLGEQQSAGSLRQYLSDHQTSLSALEGTEGFAPESLNQIDLVDNLFSDLSTEVDVIADLRPVVGDLQIPLAKLALLEPQFFANRDHPARGVIDKVAKLSDSINYPNQALESQVSGIIDNIVDNYDDESTVFQSALTALDKLTDQQERALERNVERVVKTQDGRQKLEKARKAVDKILRSRIRPPMAPKPIVELVDNGWRDLLILTYVKQGPNSKAWKEYVKTLDLLSLWLIEKQKGGATEQVEVERALEADPFIDMVRQQISEALPSNLGHEYVLDELRDVLSGKVELEHTEVDPPADDLAIAPEEIRKKVETLPRLRRWVKRGEDLELGSWLSFKDKEGARRRMQLAWVSEDRDHYIFVNERGQKMAEMSGVELAKRLSRGTKAPTPADELPLVDQSMYKTLEHVTKSLSFEQNHDSLTQLVNRETFLTQVDTALNHAKSKHAAHALLYLDIDQFALVNDVYDELTGDQVLIEFARLLSQQHDKKISSARLEGDTFGVLLLDKTLEQATEHAESLRGDIEQSPVSVDNDKVSFTVSIGICAILDHSSSVEEIMENAERAVQEAKEQGRNKVVLFHEDQHKAIAYKAEEAATKSDIEKTLDTKNFVLQAQPIARADTASKEATIELYEVLLGLEDEDGKLGSPQEFIDSAERFGYMTEVDRWVVKQVFIWICLMMDEQKVVPSLSINLSGNSITDDKFMEYLFEQISEYGVGTNKICFEITESGTISNMVKASDFVNEFKNIGCKFSIDDFGTGIASHSYLRELPVDYVKIDGSFIQNIHENPKDYAMTKSINDLAHFLGQETIAEFAESQEVIDKLCELGVDYVQGWGVGKPIPLTELAKQLDSLEK